MGRLGALGRLVEGQKLHKLAPSRDRITHLVVDDDGIDLGIVLVVVLAVAVVAHLHVVVAPPPPAPEPVRDLARDIVDAGAAGGGARAGERPRRPDARRALEAGPVLAQRRAVEARRLLQRRVGGRRRRRVLGRARRRVRRRAQRKWSHL